MEMCKSVHVRPGAWAAWVSWCISGTSEQRVVVLSVPSSGEEDMPDGPVHWEPPCAGHRRVVCHVTGDIAMGHGNGVLSADGVLHVAGGAGRQRLHPAHIGPVQRWRDGRSRARQAAHCQGTSGNASGHG
eukprot:CAMPEP_0179017804 /NCGR_PEP_ID=MMETSP0796-20121207/4028_1 /TAXON_ID=73915 /ORGANISM="Pyrodinium bahamense, Strain pbaha01" /LENGTH=129 /DNA_ID=CAMNT_0020713545 /DNA_START=6 /DNA_END=391 /DNA_ORIENTATION=-